MLVYYFLVSYSQAPNIHQLEVSKPSDFIGILQIQKGKTNQIFNRLDRLINGNNQGTEDQSPAL